jgi:hypothetical protein
VVAGTSGVAYSVLPVNGASDYLWTVPLNAIITSGQFGNSITVDFLPSFTGGYVGVKSRSQLQ